MRLVQWPVVVKPTNKTENEYSGCPLAVAAMVDETNTVKTKRPKLNINNNDRTDDDDSVRWQ